MVIIASLDQFISYLQYIIVPIIYHQPWEQRLERAQESGSLVSLENLDPSYTSAEVEVCDKFPWFCVLPLLFVN